MSVGNKSTALLAPYPVDMVNRRSGKCTSCTHPDRAALDRDLLEGASAPVVAERYGLNRESVRRHRVNHLHVSTGEAQTANNALTIIGYAHDLYERAVRLLDRAEESVELVGGGLEGALDGPSRRLQAAAATLREVRSSIELLAKLVTTEAPAVDGSRDAALDAQIQAAIIDLVLPALGPGPGIEDAEIVSDVPH